MHCFHLHLLPRLQPEDSAPLQWVYGSGTINVVHVLPGSFSYDRRCLLTTPSRSSPQLTALVALTYPRLVALLAPSL